MLTKLEISKNIKRLNIKMPYKGNIWNPEVVSSFKHLPDMLSSQEPH